MDDIRHGSDQDSIWKTLEKELGADFPLSSGTVEIDGNNQTSELSDAVSRAKLLLEEKLRRCADLVQELAKLENTPTTAERAPTNGQNANPNNINFPYWVKLEFWTVAEGLALSFGIDPDALKNQNLNELIDDETCREYTQARNIATRSFIDKGGLGRRLTPEYFMRWAQSKALPVNLALIEAFERFGFLSYTFTSINRRLVESESLLQKRDQALVELQRRVNALLEDDDESFSPRRRRSYLLVIAGLLRKCGIDWNQRAQAQRLCAAVDAIGRNLGDDTARSILKEVQKELGEQPLPKED
ncbi:hypothetical protein NCG89_12035 [Spongiibacter taiwanensis]|uniref:hypothetical protein n=1 Tax=Spongiibacter taiwanensis TaxID=1748242 RepID=UPI002035B6BC|nr:hypothetical protein [Spongiibacter taiwanensis]USA42252.1 hypothetical protein NCG89_12035 [Spongiibacter taiwanensis]